MSKRLTALLLALLLSALAAGIAAGQVAVDCINAAGLWYRCNDVFVMVVFGG